MKLKTNPAVPEKFDTYPEVPRQKLQALRKLILDTAKSIEEVPEVEESLKWGEPSYRGKHGSTIRIDWKAKAPGQYAMYFQCSSLLIPTFRKVFADQFRFEGKRAIVFEMEEEVPVEALRHCIAAGLRYHKVKDLPLLGL